MTINKFQGRTKEEAIEKARQELGEAAVIMNVKEVKPKGILRAFKSSTYEVTAALEEREVSVSPRSALGASKKIHDSISLAADERIDIPPIAKSSGKSEPILGPEQIRKAENSMRAERRIQEPDTREPDTNIEKRLDDLSTMLEEKLGVPKTPETEAAAAQTAKAQSSEELNFVRVLYNTLINNEVNEKYVNQIMDEVEQFIKPGNSVDVILSNVYQKMILRFGRPETIRMTGRKPKIIFFVGPTGVGKTTTIAKIASKYKVEQDKRVAFITADTYRIAATEQLRVYANILDAPLSVVYGSEDLNGAVARMEDYDLIFVDTAGFSHKNEVQRSDMKKLIDGTDPAFSKEVYLVLSATTKYKDLQDIIDIYKEIAPDFKLIFTKLDETGAYGNLLNVKLYSGADLSYVTNGQNVPDDIEVFNTQKVVKQLLGGGR